MNENWEIAKKHIQDVDSILGELIENIPFKYWEKKKQISLD